MIQIDTRKTVLVCLVLIVALRLQTAAALDKLTLHGDPMVHVLDLTNDFVNAGMLKKEFFSPDNIHLTQEGGYERYAQKLKPLGRNSSVNSRSRHGPYHFPLAGTSVTSIRLLPGAMSTCASFGTRPRYGGTAFIASSTLMAGSAGGENRTQKRFAKPWLPGSISREKVPFSATFAAEGFPGIF